MPKTDDYGSLSNDHSKLQTSHGHHTSFDQNSEWRHKRRSLSQIPEDKSCRFEASLVTSVFSGRGLGAGAGSVEQSRKSWFPCFEGSSYTRRQMFILACVIYGNFWVAACVSLQAPFFPREAELKGASSTIYGLVFGVYELLIITMSPVFGKLITKISPNFLVQAGLFLCGLSTVLFG